MLFVALGRQINWDRGLNLRVGFLRYESVEGVLSRKMAQDGNSLDEEISILPSYMTVVSLSGQVDNIWRNTHQIVLDGSRIHTRKMMKHVF